MKVFFNIVKSFSTPFIVVLGILMYILFFFLNFKLLSNIIILSVIIYGSFGTVKETVASIFNREFGLDYIAIGAILLGLITGEYIVAAILVLMITGGKKLEEYGTSQAKKSLKYLIDRIPTEITLWENNIPGKKLKISEINEGDEIFIKKGEVIGLDGVLLSPSGETDESSLTGEPYFIEKKEGDVIRSGTVNIGQPIVVKVTKTEKNSTYKKIIEIVKKAQEEKTPMIRLADKYSGVFTLVTFTISVFVYIISNFDLNRVLAVLAIATPCPLIIATPIAFLGGVNAAAKKKIIIKKLAALEVLSEVNAILFDKTGTITLGSPKLKEIITKNNKYTEQQALAIAVSIERNSLHPMAKALVQAGSYSNTQKVVANKVTETVGKGISAIINGKKYSLSKIKNGNGMEIELTSNDKQIAIFKFEDEIKHESKQIIENLMHKGFILEILTGDKEKATQKILDELEIKIKVKSDCTPLDKQNEIQSLKRQGKVIAMVGDGINDAPALAKADVGLAFSSHEQTAASDAADIVFLDGNFSVVLQSLNIAKRTLVIAKQSIFWGMGLSFLAMMFASFGAIPPIVGAGLQEVIDVAVILNSLRASKQ